MWKFIKRMFDLDPYCSDCGKSGFKNKRGLNQHQKRYCHFKEIYDRYLELNGNKDGEKI